MANHTSAKKSIRQIERRTLVNKNRMSRVRTFVKKAEIALGMHTQKALSQAEVMPMVVAAERELMKAVSKGTILKATASRKVSRLVKRAKALA
ncbi:MAG: 30S ribosomal protein S20 [Alphaproteobacteria bacterium]|nr:30S ribosomal protein S20 [Alphaproteobacteria bacterium]